ncbi:MAG TPA: hypothetical protein VK150_06495 [Geothrix sp.]|nr:hypothetical protein [Geothrix sp.]
MDLSKIKAVPTILVTFSQSYLDGVEMELSGPSHTATKAAERKRDDAMAQAGRKGLQADVRRKILDEYLAARILSWKGIEWDGEEMACNVENALKILGAPDLSSIREELLAALGDDERNYKSA